MSIRVMQWVWDESTSRGTDRLVLLAIADNAHDDGDDAYPSVETLMRKTGTTRRTVQRAIEALVDLGELRVVEGGGRSRTNRYTILMQKGCQPDTVSEPETASNLQETASNLHVNSVSVTPEPSLNRQNPLAPSPDGEPAEQARPRDHLFDATVTACGINPEQLTPPARGALNRALRDIRSVNGTPQDVRARAGEFRKRYPQLTLTPTALAKHWPQLGPVVVEWRARSRTVGEPRVEELARPDASVAVGRIADLRGVLKRVDDDG